MLSVLMLMALPASAVKFDTSGTGSPLRKVIKLIEGMQSKLEMEGEQDKNIYDKQACWCTTNIDEKTNSIDTGNKRIKYLENSVVMLASESAKLEQEVVNLKKDIAADTAALDQATTLRKAEKTEFMEHESKVMEMVDQVVRAEQAVNSAPSSQELSEENPGVSELQTSSASVKALLTNLQKKVAMAATLLDENHRSNVDEFLNSDIGASKGAIFLQRQKSPPQDSQAAMGVLTGLEEDFIFNLGNLRTKETQRLLEYNKMSKAKTAEIKAMNEQVTNKEDAKSDADQKRSDNKKEIKSTKEQVAEDEAFLADAKEKCRLIDKEWMERSKTRATEAEVLDKTKQIIADQYEKNDALNSFVQEDGQMKPSNNFWGSFNAPAFLQESSESGLRARASKTLMKAGQRLDSRLVTLALEAKLDSFKRVKKAIQEMVDALKKEQADEVTKRDWCIAEMNQNEMDTQETNQTKELQIAAIAELAASIKGKQEDASTLKAEIAELNKQMKLAQENREEENKEYQEMIVDQRETQQALGMALAVLRGFYPDTKVSLEQVEAKEAVQTDGGDPMPEGFKEYKKSQGGAGIMQLMQQLLEDSKLIEAQGLQAESESQADYEDFTKRSVESVHTKSTAIRQLDTARSKQEIQKSEKTEGRDLSISEITQLEISLKQLHDTCDFVLAQFTNRQKARSDEMDALGEAKAILSGASGSSAFGSD